MSLYYLAYGPLFYTTVHRVSHMGYFFSEHRAGLDINFSRVVAL